MLAHSCQRLRLVPYRSFNSRPHFEILRNYTMASSVDALNAELVQQTELFNTLRIENSDPVALEESRKRLGEIKRELASLKPTGKDAKKKERLLLKTPKVRTPTPASSQLARPHPPPDTPSTLKPIAFPPHRVTTRARATMDRGRCSAGTTWSGS